MLKIGTTVTIYDPGSKREHESWTRGIIIQTLAGNRNCSHPVHVVRINGMKWDKNAPWGAYDGVPEVMAREHNGSTELGWEGVWTCRCESEYLASRKSAS